VSAWRGEIWQKHCIGAAKKQGAIANHSGFVSFLVIVLFLAAHKDCTAGNGRCTTHTRFWSCFYTPASFGTRQTLSGELTRRRLCACVGCRISISQPANSGHRRGVIYSPLVTSRTRRGSIAPLRSPRGKTLKLFRAGVPGGGEDGLCSGRLVGG